MKRISIVDIAAELGYSASTVSRALQDHPEISAETKRIVQEYAREHNYRPNVMASNLRRSRSNTIGLILPTLTRSLFSSVLAGIEQVAGEAGYHILICQSGESKETEKQQIETLLNAHVAGVIACPSMTTDSFEHFLEVINLDTPLVVMGGRYDLPCHQIVTDAYHSAYQATEYLIQTGCRQIALYRGPLHQPTSMQFVEGYKAALQRYGLLIDEELIVECTQRRDAVIFTPTLLNKHPETDAILASSDQTAAGVLRAAKLLGKEVPAQLQICGCGNDAITRYSDPLISTIDPHALEIGRISMQRMIDCLGDNPPAPEMTSVSATLLLRETTK